jgi:hypothetical protein
MTKKVSFTAKPTAAKAAASADTWVENRKTPTEEEEAMKRLTFDIPETLHRRIKTQCASKGTKMTDELRLLLEKHFPAQKRA